MPDQAERTSTKAVLTAVAPELFVSDIKASCDFFTQKLGFSIVFVYGEPPFYGRVKRGRAELNLKCVDAPVIDPALRDRESLLSADMTVDTAEEIKQLFLEFQSAGVTFHQTLKRMPWGAKTFIVKDPDGNLLLFAGPRNEALADTRREMMMLDLSHIGQIALPVSDVDRSESFYEKSLGLRKLFRFGDLSFFDCAGVRLLLDKPHDGAEVKPQGCIYFRCADIALAVKELAKRGVSFTSTPHLIAKMDDHDLWKAFFTDPDGHTLALMQEAPKGYVPRRLSGRTAGGKRSGGARK